MKDLIWNFPSASYGTEESFDNNNIDTFADDRLGNLAREILQNSIDARLDTNEPVRIEFRTFKTAKNKFPGLNSFLRYIENWLNYHKDDDPTNNKDLIFAQKVYDSIKNDEEMLWLRISDFNTTGLWGATTLSDHSTPWFAFVHGSGKNSKQNKNSGGSKGVGKNAIFANSLLQSLFVSTLTKNSERASTGVGFLVSSQEDVNDPESDWTQGVGFCVENNSNAKKNRPILELLKLDDTFDRASKGIGTDIFIPAFMYTEKWKQEIIGQSILSFMPAILNNELSVTVVDGLYFDENISVEKSNIKDLIGTKTAFKSKAQKDTAQNIYNALTSKAHTKYEYKGKPGFEMEIFILQDELIGDDTLYSYRCPTNMFIRSYSLSSYVKCTAVLLIKGEEITARLRSVEDATHSKWSKGKYSKTRYTEAQIEEAILEVERFKDKVANSFGSKGTDSILDFDYMRNNGWCSDEPDEEITKAAKVDSGLPIDNATFSIKNDPNSHKAKKRPLKKKNNKPDPEGDASNWLPSRGEEQEEDELLGSHPNGQNNDTSLEPHLGKDETNVDETKNGKLMMIRKNVATIMMKLVSINPTHGQFTLLFTPKSTGENIEIEIYKSGVGSEDIEAVKVIKAKNGIHSLKTYRNRIHMKRIERGETYRLNLILDVEENYVWEVNISADE